MQYKHNKELVPFAKELRKKMTKEERHLWYDFLRGYPVRFLRQKVIGKFIVDFYCAEAKLVIELDGSQHGEAEAIEYDSERTAFLKNYGLCFAFRTTKSGIISRRFALISIRRYNNPSVKMIFEIILTAPFTQGSL